MTLRERILGTDAELVDLASRTLWTFVQAFVGLLIAAGLDTTSQLGDLGLVDAAAASGIAAALTVLSGYARKRVAGPPGDDAIEAARPDDG